MDSSAGRRPGDASDVSCLRAGAAAKFEEEDNAVDLAGHAALYGSGHAVVRQWFRAVWAALLGPGLSLSAGAGGARGWCRKTGRSTDQDLDSRVGLPRVIRHVAHPHVQLRLIHLDGAPIAIVAQRSRHGRLR